MSKKRPLRYKWLFAVLPLLVAVLLYFLLPLFPKFTEYVFTRGVFRLFCVPLTFLLSCIPFSVTELVVLLAVPTLLSLTGIFVYRLIKRQDRKSVAEKGARFVCWCISIAALMFMIMDGGNFSRLSVGELMSLHNQTYDAAFLQQVTIDIAQKTSAARLSVAEDENGYMQLSGSVNTALLTADDCYRPLRETYPFLFSGVWRVKPVTLSRYWSYTGYTGVYCPWLGEVSVNVDMPHSSLYYTATHEIAHTMGFAREDACNFIAFLACSTSEIPDAVYSGYLSAFVYCYNALYAYDPTLCADVRAVCSDSVFRDLKQRNTYWKQFEGDVMTSSQDFNDAFIKVNGVQSGVLSYNQVVSLILQYYNTYIIV